MKYKYHLIFFGERERDYNNTVELLKKHATDFLVELISEQNELVEHLTNNKPDIVICDYETDERAGIKVFEKIHQLQADLPIVMLYSDVRENELVEVMMEGVADFVRKDKPRRLIPVINREVKNYTGHRKKERRLSDSHQRYQALVQSVDGIVWEADAKTFEFKYVSPQSKKILGYSPQSWYDDGHFWKSHILPEDREKAVKFCHYKTEKGEDHSFEYRMITADNDIVWLRDYVTVVEEEGNPALLRGVMVDITESKLLSEIDQLENRLLTYANTNKRNDIQEILDLFVEDIESIFPRMIPSVLRLDGDKLYSWAASDRLTSRYMEAIEGIEIGPNVGSCGTAVYQDKEIIVSDISIDPRWENYKEIALKDDLKACWSQPLADSHGQILGTFAIYYTDPKEPTQFEKKILDRAKNVLQVLIENERSEKELAEKKKLLNKVYAMADIGHWEVDMKTEELTWSENVYKLHEVDDKDFELTLESGVSFFKEGKSRETIERVINRTIKTGEPYDVELKIITDKGNERWIRALGDGDFEDGECVRLYGSSQDITQRKEMEIQLKDTRKKLSDIIENSTNMFYKHDTNRVLSFLSPQSKQFLGYPPEEAKKRWTEFVTDHPKNEEGFKKTQKAIDTGKAQPPFELQLRKKGGDIKWVQVNEAPIVEDGETVAIVGSLTDITDRKKYEERLERLSLVASKTTDIILMTDENVRMTWANEAFEQFTGYTPNDYIGEHPGELLCGVETDQQTLQRVDRAVEAEESIQDIILNYTSEGEPYWVDMTVDPLIDDDGNCEGFICVEKIVTEEIKQKKKLQESVERYDIVSKATSDTIWDLNLKSDVIRYNNNIYKMFGYKKNQVEKIGQWWREKIHPEDRDEILIDIENAIRSNKDRFQMEYRFKAADGMFKHIYDRAFIVTDEEGIPIRIIGAMQDITRQKAEKKWLKLFESAVSNTTESVAILEVSPSDDKGRKLLYVNEAFTDMTGYESEEILGETLKKLIGPETDEKKCEKLEQALDNRDPIELEYLSYKKNGEKFWVQVSMAPVKGKEEEFSHWIYVGRNITDRRRRETKLRDSLNEKEILLMEIHHRVKNNLAVVSGMMQLQAYEAQSENLKQQLFNCVVRIKTMGTIHELLYQSESFSDLSLDKNIKKLISVITDTFQTKADLKLNFDLDEVTLNINQAIPCSLIVNEVVTNVLKHAYDEKEVGTLKVELREKSEELYLHIEDNGKGLPENVNLMNGSSSLGIQLIKTLVNQLAAEYEYESTNNGTAFRMWFEKTEMKGIGSAHIG